MANEENDELYVLLNGRRLDRPYRWVKHECTGTHICSPRSGPMSAKELMAFQP